MSANTPTVELNEHPDIITAGLQQKITRRGMLKGTLRLSIATMAMTSGSLAWAEKVEADWIDVEEHDLILPRLPASFDGYRLVLASDIHVDDWMVRERFMHVVGLINAQQGDAIVLTGDYVSYYHPAYPPLLTEGLSKLHARDGVIGVMGNHDHWARIHVTLPAVLAGGVQVLNNDVSSIRRGDDYLHICGVDDSLAKKTDVQRVVRLLDEKPAGCAVLLAHEPDVADETAATGRFDLQLSGHTHGGQIRTIFGNPIMLPPGGRKYHSGLYKVGSMWQYTNRGLGAVALRMRFNCRPEITVLTLRSPKVTARA